MKTNDIQEIFDSMNETFLNLETEFMELEKGYFLLTDNFERITDYLSQLHQMLIESNNKSLAKRIIAMKAVIVDMRKKRGYDIGAFQSIFFLMKSLVEQAPQELISVSKLDNSQQRSEKALLQLEKTVFQKRLTQSNQKAFNLQKFALSKRKFQIMVNADMKFLIEADEILWQKKIQANKIKQSSIRILIKNISSEPIKFFLLPGDAGELRPGQPKTAFLVKRKGNHEGFIADAITGQLYLDEKLLKKKIEYLDIAGSIDSQPFLQLRGERYYLRSL